MSIPRFFRQNVFFLVGFGILIGVALFMLLLPFLKARIFYRSIDQIQRRPDFVSAQLVVAAKYEGADDDLVDYNTSRWIHPGSNFKLFTAVAALKYLHQDFSFSTFLFLRRNGNKEHLVLQGGGDPSFKQKDFAGFVEAVKKHGKISGDIFYDDSYFEGETLGPSWGQDWVNEYFAVPITGLQINDNLLEIRGLENEKTKSFEITTLPLENYHSVIDEMTYVDDPEKLKRPVTALLDTEGRAILKGDSLRDLPFSAFAVIKDPSRATAEVFKQELVRANLISSSAKVQRFTGKKPGEQIFQYQSPPLKDLVYRMLKFSKNNYAETLVRTLGKEVNGRGTQADGVEVLNNFFDEAGIQEDEVHAVDGSGLSPKTRVSASAILQLFAYVNTQEWEDLFWSSLPQSQVDGTLKHRFANAGLEHTVIAKTGTHEFSSSLSGKILREKEGRKNILFSIHVYNHPFSTEESVARVIPIIDKIVALLDRQF